MNWLKNLIKKIKARNYLVSFVLYWKEGHDPIEASLVVNIDEKITAFLIDDLQKELLKSNNEGKEIFSSCYITNIIKLHKN